MYFRSNLELQFIYYWLIVNVKTDTLYVIRTMYITRTDTIYVIRTVTLYVTRTDTLHVIRTVTLCAVVISMVISFQSISTDAEEDTVLVTSSLTVLVTYNVTGLVAKSVTSSRSRIILNVQLQNLAMVNPLTALGTYMSLVCALH
jgi:hypothetical protein